MDQASDYTVLSALAAAFVAGVTFYATRIRKRYSIAAVAAKHEATVKGTWNITIQISNTGRRPVSLAFLTVEKPGDSSLQIPFGDYEPVIIEAGVSIERNVTGNAGEGFWESEKELEKSKIMILDTRRKSHRVRIQEKSGGS